MDAKLLEKIIHDLQGTCQSLSGCLENYDLEEDDLSPDDLEEIDNNIFLCEECGWWCGLEELDEGHDQGMRCEDCCP